MKVNKDIKVGLGLSIIFLENIYWIYLFWPERAGELNQKRLKS